MPANRLPPKTALLPLSALMLAACACNLPPTPPVQPAKIPAPPLSPALLEQWQPRAQSYSQKVQTYFERAREITTSGPQK
jgi:hypothetical protein